MQGLSILVGQVVSLVIEDKIDHGSLWECGRFIQDETAVLYLCTQPVHDPNLGPSRENATYDTRPEALSHLVGTATRRVQFGQLSRPARAGKIHGRIT